MKDVIIKIKGIQSGGGENDVIEFSTDGKMDTNGDKITLLYDEGKMLEDAKIKTRVEIIGADTVVTERTGDMSSRLVVQKHRQNTCFYATPYGELNLEIYGEDLKSEFTSSGGWLSMRYSISSGNTKLSENDIKIEVREIEV